MPPAWSRRCTSVTTGGAYRPLSSGICVLGARRQPCCTLFPYTTLFRSRRRPPGSWRWRLAAGSPSPFRDRKSTRLNSSHRCIPYAVFGLKKKNPLHLTCIDRSKVLELLDWTCALVLTPDHLARTAYAIG